MPKTVRSFQNIKKVLKQYKLLYLLSYDMNQVYKTVILKNQPLKMIQTDIDNYICPVCESKVDREFFFCPHCSQKIKK